MKITTTITQTIEKADGETVTIGRTRISDHGDNPAFQRREAATAAEQARDEFIDKQCLAGTRPI